MVKFHHTARPIKQNALPTQQRNFIMGDNRKISVNHQTQSLTRLSINFTFSTGNWRKKPVQNKKKKEERCCATRLGKHLEKEMQQFGDVLGTLASCSYCNQGMFQVLSFIYFRNMLSNIFPQLTALFSGLMGIILSTKSLCFKATIKEEGYKLSAMVWIFSSCPPSRLVLKLQFWADLVFQHCCCAHSTVTR